MFEEKNCQLNRETIKFAYCKSSSKNNQIAASQSDESIGDSPGEALSQRTNVASSFIFSYVAE